MSLDDPRVQTRTGRQQCRGTAAAAAAAADATMCKTPERHGRHAVTASGPGLVLLHKSPVRLPIQVSCYQYGAYALRAGNACGTVGPRC